MNSKKAISHLRTDHILRMVIEKVTLPQRPPRNQVYQSLMRAIVGQQLSVKAAATIYQRFIALFPTEKTDPESVLALSTEDLRSVGLSAQKSGYVHNVATYFKYNNLHHFDWSGLSDDMIIERLTTIKGVGKWTVEMILMFTLKRPDVFPVDDLGIQNAMQSLYALNGSKKEIKFQMEQIAEDWKPFRTLACEYLWAWKDDDVMN